MTRLTQWLRSMLPLSREKKSLKDHDDPRPPDLDPCLFLPEQRPRALTPSSSCDDLSAVDAKSAATYISNYGLFQRLPYELRRMILVHAFGDRRLHLDMYYNYPLAPTAVCAEATPPEYARDLETEEAKTTHPVFVSRRKPFLLEPAARGDTTLPRQWQWFSCVCQRPAGIVEIIPEGCEVGPRCLQPCDDQCLVHALNGTGPWAPQHGHFGHSELSIGIMGWLLSCRSAYAEGTDVLFSTNTFHISSLELMMDLPRLVPPHKLRRVVSLELLWNFSTWCPRYRASGYLIDPTGHLTKIWTTHKAGEPIPDDAPLYRLSRMIPVTFPRVRNLYISLDSFIHPPDGLYDSKYHTSIAEAVILAPIEDMLRMLGPQPGRIFRIAIPQHRWHSWCSLYKSRYGKSPTGFVNCDMYGEVWKSLMTGPEGRRREKELPKGSEEHPGYWLCTGWNDTFLQPMYCFGTGPGPEVDFELDVVE